jgi:hypothetical protein
MPTRTTTRAAGAPVTQLPQTGFLRLKQIVRMPPTREVPAREGRPRRRARPGSPGIFPIGASTWWSGVKSGRFPKPVRIGPRTTVWRVEDILDLVARLSADEQGG